MTEDLFAPSLQDVPRLGPPPQGERPEEPALVVYSWTVPRLLLRWLKWRAR